MKILAIDTSCDDTAVAVSDNDCILSNKIASQIEVHKEWGGVVPSIARRMHGENIDAVLNAALAQAKVSLDEIDVFACTYGPGLAIALEVGLSKARELVREYKKPFVGVNHMEGHIYSALARNSAGNPELVYDFPLVALLVSGGHTELVLMEEHGSYSILGQTLDDAAGEAFDKVARMLELGYPGGPVIEELAAQGDAERFAFPIPLSKERTANFSYSGLKTAVLYTLPKVLTDELTPVERKQTMCDIAASFQKTAIDALIKKTQIALEDTVTERPINDLLLGGGVSANTLLRKRFREHFGGEYRIHYPTDKKLYGDNAGMIAVAAYHNAVRGNFMDIEDVDRDPGLAL